MREFPGNSVGQMCLNKARLCYFITVLSARRPEGFLSSRRPPLCLLCQISDIVLGGSKGAATPRFIQTNWLNPSSLISDLLRALITHGLYVSDPADSHHTLPLHHCFLCRITITLSSRRMFYLLLIKSKKTSSPKGGRYPACLFFTYTWNWNSHRHKSFRETRVNYRRS